MKLICWNVNGLRSIQRKGLQGFLEEQQPDVLCLQETKICEDQLTAELEPPPSYRRICSSAQKRGYSGVATYLRTTVPCEEEKLLRGLGNTSFDNEGRYLVTRHPHFVLYNIYFPSGTTGEARQQVKYDFLDHFLEHLQTLSAADRERLIICGDFNICHRPIDIHHPETAEKRKLSGFLPEERAWMDRFVDYGFVDTFRLIHGDIEKAYTWWTFRAGARQKNLGWRIDYIFVSEALAPQVRDAGILNTCEGSDHCPIFADFSF
ncbi:MAG: exodeoxyribonuclease III [Bdellovibrionales bacterium]|nr:exodeoxyribonuclease III [Bdellovibrionales bacterium]